MNALRTFDGVDLTNRLVHLTHRTQNPLGIDLPDEISNLTPGRRLAAILRDQHLRSFETYGSGEPVVCLSEALPAAISLLIADGRYKPWGLTLSKQFVFEQGGGPCFYVRGDDWAEAASWPSALRARCVRYWPGAEPTGEDEPLPNHLATTSEWLHEREWRVVGNAGLAFDWAHVEYLILPGNTGYDALSWLSTRYAELGGVGNVADFFAQRHVLLDQESGELLSDPGGFWSAG